MANRAVDADVKVYIDTARDTTPFINNANLVVNEELVGKGLSDDRLKLIETLLAAHFCCLVEEKGGLQRTETGQSTDSYQRRDLKGNEGLASTRYGEQAIAMDSSGTLSSLSIGAKNLRAQFTVMGSNTPAVPVNEDPF